MTDPLRVLLDGYLDTGSVTRESFDGLASVRGWSVSRRHGVLVATTPPGRIVAWANLWPPTTRPEEPRRPSTEHTCGWAKVDGVWACVQDYYAAGSAPGSGCGLTWRPM